MTAIASLEEFVEDQLPRYCEEEVDNPEQWYVINGQHVSEYSVWNDVDLPEDYEEQQSEMPEEDRDANPPVDGFNQIGTLGWPSDGFDIEDDSFVAKAQWGDEVDTRMLGLLIVHESVLSEKALQIAAGADPQEVDA